MDAPTCPLKPAGRSPAARLAAGIAVTTRAASPARRRRPLRDAARGARCVVASDLRRSIESAACLAPVDTIRVEASLREVGFPESLDSSLRLSPGLWVFIARAAQMLIATTTKAAARRPSPRSERGRHPVAARPRSPDRGRHRPRLVQPLRRPRAPPARLVRPALRSERLLVERDVRARADLSSLQARRWPCGDPVERSETVGGGDSTPRGESQGDSPAWLRTPSSARNEPKASGWCERGDSNPHGIATASPSSWCVCQFRHFREEGRSGHAP